MMESLKLVGDCHILKEKSSIVAALKKTQKLDSLLGRLGLRTRKAGGSRNRRLAETLPSQV